MSSPDEQARSEEASEREASERESPERGTADELGALIERYLDSKSRGARDDGTPTGTYRASAASELRRWRRWMHARGYAMDDLADDGGRVMRRYAMHLARRTRGEDGIAASTARTYFAYVSGCLSYAVRDGALPLNPALTERAREELPDDSGGDRTDQQFWSRDQRRRLVRFADERAARAVDDAGFSAVAEVRDRALVRVLAYAAVRGAEVLRHPKDNRPGRQGLRWRNVDLDAGTMRVLGKDQRRESALLPREAAQGLERLRAVQRPPSEEWPVFPTDHAPSKYRAVRDALGDDAAAILDEADDVDAVLRRHDVTPPALTTEGARSVMRRLTAGANIDVPDEGVEYLQLHGARRGMLEDIYRRDRGDAQDLARHKSLSTTREAYQHIDAEERTKRIDAHLDEIA
ncbi:tyrosine-type recombinase/integrase [Halomarina halobia]|uniref:Tyrosine-type recombinase/integrase n=1 Tax=Halomarina halobia TaxID=3033386 RepID=A0ABD6AFZ0_9EURY|nr:tyrosine-type recombinase/integrase [Halomarina sp. PSR21]